MVFAVTFLTNRNRTLDDKLKTEREEKRREGKRREEWRK
jgi:hypothetical protein